MHISEPAGRLVLTLLTMGVAAACSGTDGGQKGGGDAAMVAGALDSLPSPAADGSAESNISAGPDGSVYLSWIEPAGEGSHAFRFAVLTDSGWSSARTIVEAGDMFVNWADFPMMLPLGEGRIAAHWLQRAEARGAYDIRLVQSADGGATWAPPVTPHRDGTQSEHGFVSLWPAGDSVMAVWLDGRKYAAGSGGEHSPQNEMTIVATAIAADGGLGAEQLLDARTCDCCQTTAAVTSRGPIVAYRDRSPTEIRDIAVVRLVDGSWTEPAHVSDDGWEIAACPVNGPALAARGDTVVVVWFTAANDTARVRLARSTDAGASWSAPVEIDGGSPVGRVDALMLDDGSALVSWLERTGGEGAEVRLRRVAVDGSADAPLTIARSDAARSSGFPRMVASGPWVYLTWTESGTPSRVQVARLRIDAPTMASR